ncbi:helix-turn-helix domain-containing protein [Halobacillus ihumii]|uniref:helix-turn-helix domain-containing protein n=1 Tax=Halobacillus ihumii TaxID=2686092 RepID=UPI0013D02382|nr:helix-turn-helix domain-containing protein [Halobacillus ihumii]
MSKNLFVKLDIETLQQGRIKSLGIDKFAILAAISTFANSKGEAFPSQDKIAEMVGYSRRTVVTKLKALTETEIDGEKVIRIVQEKTAKGRRNKYIISPVVGFTFGVKSDATNVKQSSQGGCETAIAQELEKEFELEPSNENQEQDNILFKNAKDVVNYFRNKYFETYESTYQPNWGRDSAMIKNKLLSNYTDEEIKTILDTVFAQYDKRWANGQFPRPTIGQICSWLANKALGVAKYSEQEEAKVEAESEKYDYDDSHYDALLDELD